MGFSICGAQFRWRRQTVESYAWEGWKMLDYPLWDSLSCYESILCVLDLRITKT